MMALRLASPSVLVDLAASPGLAAVTVGATGLRIAAMARQRDVERDARVARHAPLLAGALPHIGHVAIRNRGTVCGSLAHADPAAELPTVALAADAELRLRSAEGARTMAASDFFTGYYSTAVRATEIVEAVELPTIGVRTGTAFVEVSRRHGDFALVGVAAVLRLDSAGAVEHVRLAVSGVASTPQRIAAAESLLLGRTARPRRRGGGRRRGARRGRSGRRPPRHRRLPPPRRRGAHRPRPAPRRRTSRSVTSPTRTCSNLATVRSGICCRLRLRRPVSADEVAVTLTVNGELRSARASSARDPRRAAARPPAADRHPPRLRARRVRGVHRPARRRSARSCLVLAWQADGAIVTTIEGLAGDEPLGPLQQACRDRHSFQCGFCTPGMLMRGDRAARRTRRPDRRRRSARRWPGTCAAARATTASSPACCVAPSCDGRLSGSPTPDRHERAARRGSADPHRPRPLRRRRRRARDAARRVRAQPVRPRPAASRSTRRRRGRSPGVHLVLTDAELREQVGPTSCPAPPRPVRADVQRARPRRGAARRRARSRSSSPIAGRSPRTPSRSSRCELRPARRRSWTWTRRWRPTRRCCSPSTAATCMLPHRAPLRRHRRRVRRRRARGRASGSSSTATPTCRWSAGASWPTGTRRPGSSTSTPRTSVRMGCGSRWPLPASPAHQLRVRCGDIGGSFGQKGGVSREDLAVCAAARAARPSGEVDRGSQREPDGRRPGSRGARRRRGRRGRRGPTARSADPSGGGRRRLPADRASRPAATRTWSAALLPAAYRIDHYDFDGVAVATNKATYVPYRGPWEVETWVRERLLDVIARAVGIDPGRGPVPQPADRRRAAPPIGHRRRAAEHQRSARRLRQAVERIDYAGFRASNDRRASRAGTSASAVANFIEPAPFMPSLIRAMGVMAAPRTVQEARIRLEPDGSFSAVHQPAAARSGPRDDARPARRRRARRRPSTAVRVVHGDTETTPFNFVGTGGSRAATLASGATMGAARAVRERVLDMASKLWEIEPADLDIVDGRGRGPGRAVAFDAPRPAGDDGLRAAWSRRRQRLAWRRGVVRLPVRRGHVVAVHTRCVVEVDVETGAGADRCATSWSRTAVG